MSPQEEPQNTLENLFLHLWASVSSYVKWGQSLNCESWENWIHCVYKLPFSRLPDAQMPRSTFGRSCCPMDFQRRSIYMSKYLGTLALTLLQLRDSGPSLPSQASAYPFLPSAPGRLVPTPSSLWDIPGKWPQAWVT